MGRHAWKNIIQMSGFYRFFDSRVHSPRGSKKADKWIVRPSGHVHAKLFLIIGNRVERGTWNRAPHVRMM